MEPGRLISMLALVVAALAPAVAQARATRWHADVDASYTRGSLHFLNVPVLDARCLRADCRVEGIDRMDVARASFGIGYGVLTIEGSVAIPAREPLPYRALSAGVRLQTSADAPIALAFRFAYLRSSVRGLEGQGGRAALAFVMRFDAAFQLYAEGSIEATTVPSELQETGTVLSYVPLVGAGIRMTLR